MSVQFQLQPIADNINTTEMYLQELELIILNCIGSQKFKWNDLKDIKRKSSITDAHQKIKTLIENSQEVRDGIRQLNREYLRLQLAIKNLAEFSEEIETKAREVEAKLINEGFIRTSVQASFFASTGRMIPSTTTEIQEEQKNKEDSIAKLPEQPEDMNIIDLEQSEFIIPAFMKQTSRFEYRVI